MSSNFNNAKIINVYYNKGDRKPYDVNGKPIAYIGEEFVGANEATELRFHFGEELDSASAIIVAKRANGDTRLDPLTLEGTGVNSYFKVRLNAWYGEYKGKMTIIFKVYNGTVTYDDPETPTQITATTGQIIVSDIFNLEVAYAPNASTLVPPFETEDYDDWFFTLSTKLDKAQSITVTGALPSLAGGVYDDRYFYVEDEGTGRLYYINGSTAIEVVWQVGTLRLTPTGNGEVTADTGKLSWNQPNGTVNVGLYNSVNIGIGEDVFYYGKASGAIVKGDIVQFAGTQGDHYLVKKAVPAEINANPKLIMGIAKQDMDNNEFGYIANFGKIEGIDTKGLAVGSFVYFASSSINNGEWTTTQPTAPNAKILLAVIVKAETSENANNGVLLVRPTIEPVLKDLQDVYVTSIANGQILRWNNTNLRWENTSALTTAESDIDALEGRMTTEEANVDNLQSRMTTAEADIANIEDGTTTVGQALADQNGNVINTTYLTQSSASATYIPLSQKGANNGVVPLNSSGKISSIYLSGEQDDIQEFADLASFPLVGEADILYVAIDTNKLYRWSGSAYVVISETLALGTTNSTAFPGDRGLALETLTDNIVDGDQALTLKNQVITNTAVGTSPLVVNAITSTTANLQEWQINGTIQMRVDPSFGIYGSALRNLANGSNSAVIVGTTGTTISRNIADTNPPLIVNKNLGTGNILQLQSAGANKLEVDVNGWLYQNGTRLFHQTASVDNTFFGTSNGNLTLTNGLNTGFGWGGLIALTSGSGNTGIGRTSLNSVTTGSNNTSLGNNSGRTITTGGTNTFVGASAGFSGAWGTQLATASNSTAIGNESFTDKSNQMVFGNASVSEFKFDRNASATILAPTIEAKNSSNQIKLFGTSVGSNQEAVFNFSTSGSNSLDIRTNYVSTANKISLSPGTITAMTLLGSGNVGIGTTSPQRLLSLVTSSNDDGIQIRRNSTTSNDYAVLGFRINTNDLPGNFAEIRGIRTNRAVATDTDLSFHTFSNTTMTERMRIRDDGNVGIGTSSPAKQLEIQTASGTESALRLRQLSQNYWDIRIPAGQTYLVINDVTAERLRIDASGLVGINETSPSAQLQVKSGATNRVPLIVNTLASQTANLQRWEVNGSGRAWIESGGDFNTNRVKLDDSVQNIVSANNSRIGVGTTGTAISRNVADTNPALIVNLANASATGNIQVWQKAGSAKLAVGNDGTLINATSPNFGNNSSLQLADNGTIISRNIADGNHALVINLDNSSSTGSILSLRRAGVTQASIARDGIAHFTGTPSNEQTGDYTLVLADKGKVLRINSATNRTVTIPLNSSVLFPIDTEIAILRYGTGTVSISPTAGVTLQSKAGERKISGQYGSVALKKIGENEWVLVGSLEA